MKRIIIYTKDVCILTGKSDRYARKLMKQIRLHLNKSKDMPLTIYDLCDYIGVDPNRFLNN